MALVDGQEVDMTDDELMAAIAAMDCELPDFDVVLPDFDASILDGLDTTLPDFDVAALDRLMAL